MKEKVMNHIKDTIIHKQYMMKSALKMYDILVLEKQEDLAIELLKRAACHDNSKFEEDEAMLLASLQSKKALMDPTVNLNEDEKKIIEQHWKKNRHHPEHFNDVKEMKKIDILEMICDWHARSEQHNTDLVEFIKIRQENRFHFPEEMFQEILKYCAKMIENKNNCCMLNNSAKKKYPIITLCGSTRFKKEFEEIQKQLTINGCIVISVGLFSHSEENSEEWENNGLKNMLDDIHKRKIDLADEIFVINKNGYIGKSTKSEIEYAKSCGKTIRYLESNV